MKFEIQLFKYLGVAVVGAAYFGVGIPMFISANSDFLSAAGILLLLLGSAGIILFVRHEINMYYKTIYEKIKKNEKGDEADESK